MNKQEKQYATGRIDSIAAEKCHAIKEKYTTDGVSLTGVQRLSAFGAGKYKIRSDVREINTYTDLCKVVEFTDESEDKMDSSRIEAEQAKVRVEATRIKDQLMLGDANEALKLIEKFAK